MPRSMTTFASVREYGDGWSCSMELRSVNGRYCDVILRIPKWMLALEDRIRKLVQSRLLRGRIELTMQVDPGEIAPEEFEPDVMLAKAYLRACAELSREAEIPGKLDLPLLLSTVKDVIRPKEKEIDQEEIWALISPPLHELLDRAEEMARQEGGNLVEDLRQRVNRIAGLLDAIDKRTEEHTRQAQEALINRIKALLENLSLDEARVAQEAAILADKLDITEERVRVRSHIGQFLSMLESDGLVGRRLDFLLQEIFREVNTMGVKSADVEISTLVVEIKAELEKMREQIQNLV